MSKTQSDKPSPLLKSRVVNMRDVVAGASLTGAVSRLFPSEVILKYFPEPEPMDAYTRTYEIPGIKRSDFQEKGSKLFMNQLVEEILTSREGRKEFQFRSLPIFVEASQDLHTLFAVGGWVNE